MKLLGNESTNQQTEEQEKNAPKIPRWLFRIIKFLFSLSPRLEKELSIFIEDIILTMIYLWNTFKKFLRLSTWITKVVLVIILLYLLWTIVPSVEIPWYVIAGPPLLSIIILAVVLVFRKKTSTPEETASTPKSPVRTGFWTPGGWFDRWVIRGRAIPIIGAVILGHILLLNSEWRQWTLDHAYTQKALLVQFAFGYGLWLLDQNPKSKPLKHRVGVVLIWLCVIVLGNEIRLYTVERIWGEKPPSTQASTSTPGQSVYVRSTNNGGNFFIPVGTPACFKEKLGPDKDPAYAAFPGQMDLMAVFCRETRFYHLGSDGKPRTNTNKNGTVDTGIAQINSVHDEELTRLGLDKNKLEDNLKYAGILYEKNGLQDWIPEIGEKLVFEVEVSDEYSNTFKMPQIDPANRPFNYGLTWNSPIVVAMDDESRIIRPSNGENLGYPKKNYKFKSKVAGKKALVTVTYQY